jgi:hypothetical protein
VEDGRLDGAGRASFERHTSSCAACAREVELLVKLRGIEQLPFIQPNPMSRRRRRAELLRRANEQILGSSKRAWRDRTGAVAIALVAAGVVLTVWRGWRTPPTSSLPLQSPLFEITSIHDARWKVLHEGPHAEVTLAFGAVLVHVEKLGFERRFLLKLPDGELEVRGTRFAVEADERHTKHVEVSEGVVALRVVNDVERTLYAGESWTAPELATAGTSSAGAAASAVAAPMPAAPVEPAPPGDLAPLAERARARRSSRAGSRGASPPGAAAPLAAATKAASAATAPVPVASQAAPGAADDGGAGVFFAGAMRAFEGGSYEKADDLFRRFEKQFSGDPRAEDASFLRIVCALRRGDRSAAEAHAHEYLGAYPDGLRRREVERLLY